MERGVTTYQVRVSAQRPQPSPEVLASVVSLDRRPLLLLVVEANGGRRLLGSTEECLLLSTSGEAQHPGTKAGLELRFEGQGAQPPFRRQASQPAALAAAACWASAMACWAACWVWGSTVLASAPTSRRSSPCTPRKAGPMMTLPTT